MDAPCGAEFGSALLLRAAHLLVSVGAFGSVGCGDANDDAARGEVGGGAPSVEGIGITPSAGSPSDWGGAGGASGSPGMGVPQAPDNAAGASDASEQGGASLGGGPSREQGMDEVTAGAANAGASAGAEGAQGGAAGLDPMGEGDAGLPVPPLRWREVYP